MERTVTSYIQIIGRESWSHGSLPWQTVGLSFRKHPQEHPPSLHPAPILLRLERGAWLMVKRVRQATNECAPPPPPPLPSQPWASLSRIVPYLPCCMRRYHGIMIYLLTGFDSRQKAVIGNNAQVKQVASRKVSTKTLATSCRSAVGRNDPLRESSSNFFDHNMSSPPPPSSTPVGYLPDNDFFTTRNGGYKRQTRKG